MIDREVRKKVLEDMKAELREAHSRRDLTFSEIVTLNGYHITTCIALEKLMMFAAVNRWRRRLEKTAIEFDHVDRADMMAAGHTDYFEKFTLHCMELACDGKVAEVR